jgi:hypothetical protein
MAREQADAVADSLRESVDVFDYLEGLLDYQYTRNAAGQLVSVRLLVAFGGPTVWVVVDGSGAVVEASWWSDVVRVDVPESELTAGLFDYFRELLGDCVPAV